MNLAGSGPRALHRIDSALSRSDPQLAGIYAVFTRLTRHEEMPSTERIRPARRRLQALLLLAVALLTTVAVVAGRAASATATACRRCVHTPQRAQGPMVLPRE